MHQSPVETALGILTKFQCTSNNPQAEKDIAFLRSMLYALQQTGIDDTNFIPPYLLNEDAYQDDDVDRQIFGHDKGESSSSLGEIVVKGEEGVECSSDNSGAGSLKRTSSELPARIGDRRIEELGEMPQTSRVSSDGFNGDAAERKLKTEKAVKSWLLSTYCRKSGKKLPEEQRSSPFAYYAPHDSAEQENETLMPSEAAMHWLSRRGDWRFNILEAKRASPHFGFLMVSSIMEDWGLLEEFHIEKKNLRRFVQKLSLGYHPNPYHNFTHALDVFQTLHYLLRGLPAGIFDQLEILGLLVGALVHDLGHDGLSNSFHVKTCTSRALDHNDRSPQENHHLMQAFTILRMDDFNVFSNMEYTDFARIREFIIHVVLHTDMSHHFELESQMKTLIAEKKGSEISDSKEGKLLLGSSLLHMADISNPAKPFGIAKYWACNLLEEFYGQGDREKALNIPVSPMCDRLSAATVPAGQVGFINFIVRPFYLVISQLIPRLSDSSLNILQENLVLWTQLDGKTVEELLEEGVLPPSCRVALEQ